MKLMKNLFMLLTVLLAGSSLNNANNANKMVVAEAAESGTSAYLSRKWKTTIGVSSSINSLLFTNDANRKVPVNGTLIGEYDVDTDPNNSIINAYIYQVDVDGKSTKECVIYADVETIYPDAGSGSGIFFNLSKVEKITFDCKFNVGTMKSLRSMFAYDVNLVQIEGLTNVVNTTNVTDMAMMFYNCPKLTSLDISSFDTSSATTIAEMFRDCKSLVKIDGLNGPNWNTSNVTDMHRIFSGCSSLTPIDVSGFNTANVTDMNGLFSGCDAITTIDGLNALDTSNVKDMQDMFGSCDNLVSLDVSNFKTSNVTTMNSMFSGCRELTTIDGLNGANWNTSNVSDMKGMFQNCTSLKSLDVSGFETSSLTNMACMFTACKNLTTITGLENFDTSKVTDMSYLFDSCSKLTSVNVSSFDTSNVTNMEYMFGYCLQLTNIEGLEGFNTSKVTLMNNMFANCQKLKEVNVSNFNTENVTNFKFMFFNCLSLAKLDLSNFDLQSIDKENTSALTNFLYNNSSNLKEIKTPKNLNGNTIELPANFGMTAIEPTMESMTLIRGSNELNTLYNTLKTLKTCEEYTKGAELQAIYNGLSAKDKATFATLTDDDGVLLIDKLNYMVNYAATKSDTGSATAGKNLVASNIASQSPVLVILIGCVSVAFIGGYYLAQKRKYAK